MRIVESRPRDRKPSGRCSSTSTPPSICSPRDNGVTSGRTLSASGSRPRSPAPRAFYQAAATAPRRRRGHGQYRAASQQHRPARARTTTCTCPRAAGTFLINASRRRASKTGHCRPRARRLFYARASDNSTLLNSAASRASPRGCRRLGTRRRPGSPWPTSRLW